MTTLVAMGQQPGEAFFGLMIVVLVMAVAMVWAILKCLWDLWSKMINALWERISNQE
jgi:hypothetical protein